MDIGIPRDYLTGTELYLNHLSSNCPDMLAKGKNIMGNVIIVINVC